MQRALVLGLALTLVSACGGGDSGPDTSIEITSPTRGQLDLGADVVVNGTVSGSDPVNRVEVNGVAAPLDADGNFSATISLLPGTNVIETIAFGDGDNLTRDLRAVSSGTLESGVAPDGTLLHYGLRGLAGISTEILPNVTIDPTYASVMGAPIKDVGGDTVTITEMNTPIDLMFVYAIANGLGGELLFLPFTFTATANYINSGGNPATGTFTFDTVELHWTYGLDITFDAGDVGIDLVNSETLFDHPLNYTNVNIDPLVFDRVATDVHIPLEAAIAAATTAEIENKTADWFDRFNSDAMIAVGSGMVARESRLVAADASGATGLLMTVTTNIDAAGQPTHVATPGEPETPQGSDAAIAISDDSLNQALGAAWRAGAFDATLPGGATLELLVPPSIRAVAEQPAVIVVGDWIATRGDTQVALAGSVLLEAGVDTVDLKLRAASATLGAQSIAGGRDDADAIRAEAEAALVELISNTVGAVSQPVANLAADELSAKTQDGFVEISVDLSE